MSDGRGPGRSRVRSAVMVVRADSCRAGRRRGGAVAARKPGRSADVVELCTAHYAVAGL